MFYNEQQDYGNKPFYGAVEAASDLAKGIENAVPVARANVQAETGKTEAKCTADPTAAGFLDPTTTINPDPLRRQPESRPSPLKLGARSTASSPEDDYDAVPSEEMNEKDDGQCSRRCCFGWG